MKLAEIIAWLWSPFAALWADVKKRYRESTPAKRRKDDDDAGGWA